MRAFPTFEFHANGARIERFEGASPQKLKAAVENVVAIAEEALLADAMLLSSFDDDMEQEQHQPPAAPPPTEEDIMPPLLTKKQLPRKVRAEEPVMAPNVTANSPAQTIQIKIFEGLKHMFLTIENTATIGALLEAAGELTGRGRTNQVLLFDKLVLDGRRAKFTLQQMGVPAAGATMRVVSINTQGTATTMTINLKSQEGAKLPVTLRPSAKLISVRDQAKEYTQTSAPKMIYLGKILTDAQNQDPIASLFENDSTIICLPFGEPYSRPVFSASEEIEESDDEEEENPPFGEEDDVYRTSSTEVILEVEQAAQNPFTQLKFPVVLDAATIWRKGEEYFLANKPIPESVQAIVDKLVLNGIARAAISKKSKLTLDEDDLRVLQQEKL